MTWRVVYSDYKDSTGEQEATAIYTNETGVEFSHREGIHVDDIREYGWFILHAIEARDKWAGDSRIKVEKAEAIAGVLNSVDPRSTGGEPAITFPAVGNSTGATPATSLRTKILAWLNTPLGGGA